MSKQYVERKSNASRAPHVRTELIHTANTAFADALGRWPTLASLQPARQAKQMLALVAACNASACFALHLCASVASPLRLSGEPPDSRRGGAVRSNLSRRASCEAARESRGSHAAGLNEAWRWSACGENVQFLVQDFALGWSTWCYVYSIPNKASPKFLIQTPQLLILVIGELSLTIGRILDS